MVYDSHDEQWYEYTEYFNEKDLDALKKKELEINKPELDFIKLFLKIICWVAYIYAVIGIIITFLRVL